MAGKKKFSDKAHEDNAKRQAAWKDRNKRKVFEHCERQKLSRRMNKTRTVGAGYLVWEIIEPTTGEIVDIKVLHCTADKPANGQLSKWVPAVPVARALAGSIKQARIEQLKQWRGEQ